MRGTEKIRREKELMMQKGFLLTPVELSLVVDILCTLPKIILHRYLLTFVTYSWHMVRM